VNNPYNIVKMERKANLIGFREEKRYSPLTKVAIVEILYRINKDDKIRKAKTKIVNIV